MRQPLRFWYFSCAKTHLTKFAKSKIQDPKIKIQNPNSKTSEIQSPKIKKSKIAKSKNPKSKNPKSKSKIMVCSCACIYVFWLHQNYTETTSYKHFFEGGVHTFFCDVKCIFGGGVSPNHAEMYETIPQ